MTNILETQTKEPRTPDPIDIHVGARLRLRRNLIGMSQEQLGRSSGLTFQQIQKYERGANRMGASRLFQLAKILDVQVSYFFDDIRTAPVMALHEGAQAPLEGQPGTDSTLARSEDELLHRRETLELIRAYYRIADPRQRRKVYELIKTLAEDLPTE